MTNKEFLLNVIQSIKKETNNVNWRGTLSNWIKC